MQVPPPLNFADALFLDLDGTLLEFAERPEAVRVAPDLRQLLQSVARRLDGALAVISGRRIATVDELLGGSVKAVAGLHGWERRSAYGSEVISGVVPAGLKP